MPARWQQWYPHIIDPWLSSDRVEDLSDAAYRAVHRLMMKQFQQPDGMLAAEEMEVARMSRKLDQWSVIRDQVLQFFPIGPSGKRFNPFLFKEWTRAKESYEKACRGAASTNSKRWGSSQSDTKDIAERQENDRRAIGERSPSVRSVPVPVPVPVQKTLTLAPSKLDATPAVITIPLIGDQEHSVSEAEVAELETLFPAVDVRQELRHIRAWNLSHPRQRKTKSGIKAHITSWLSKEQNRPRLDLSRRSGDRPSDAWMVDDSGPQMTEEEIEEIRKRMESSEKASREKLASFRGGR